MNIKLKKRLTFLKKRLNRKKSFSQFGEHFLKNCVLKIVNIFNICFIFALLGKKLRLPNHQNKPNLNLYQSSLDC